MILLILCYFCRKTVSVLHIALTDNLSSSGFASTELPKQRFCGKHYNSMLPAWSGISPCRLRWVVLLSFPCHDFWQCITEMKLITEHFLLLNVFVKNSEIDNNIDCTIWKKWIWYMTHSALFERQLVWSQGIENFITISLFVFCSKGFWSSPLADFFFFLNKKKHYKCHLNES